MENKLDKYLGKMVVVTLDTMYEINPGKDNNYLDNVRQKGILLGYNKENIRLKINPIKDQPIVFTLDLGHVTKIAAISHMQEKR